MVFAYNYNPRKTDAIYIEDHLVLLITLNNLIKVSFVPENECYFANFCL